jgi:hypothetical protein
MAVRFGWIAFGAVIVVAVVGAAQLRDAREHPARPHARRAVSVGEPLVLGSGAPANVHAHARGEVERHPPLHTAPAQAQQAAASFLKAYLAYEVGRADARSMRVLHATASQALWRELNDGRGQPHPTTPMRPARLVRLVRGVGTQRRLAALIATIRRTGRRTGLMLVVRRVGGRWRVEGIGR